MLGIVLTYCVFVFVNLALDDPEVQSLVDDEVIEVVQDVFLCIDLAFLCWFVIEMLLYLYVFGPSFFKDAFVLVDAAIVITSFVLTCIAVRTLEQSAKVVSLSLPILKVVRVVRVLRVVLALTRLQRSRERYRRRKMLGLQAPVTRVVELLAELRRTECEEGDEDAKMLLWTTELIAKEELYKASVHSHTGGRLTAEMADWMRSNLQVSVPIGERSVGGAGASSAQSRMSVANLKNANKALTKTSSRSTSNDKDEKTKAEFPIYLSQILTPEGAVLKHMANVDEWNWDVFTFTDICNNKPLVIGGVFLMERYGFLDGLDIPRDKLAAFLNAIEEGYIASNPFHNAVHATDVMFTLHYFLRRGLLRDLIGSLDQFAALLAALVHDFAHPGVSNAFLTNTRATEAILYNDQSILEMFHVAGAFRTMLTKPGCNLAQDLSRTQFRQLRETMVSMILATDMKVHFEHLGRLKTRIATDAYATVERKDVLFLLGQALHAADISNPAKPPFLQMRWTQRVIKEFHLQGDKEKELGVPVSAFMDREKSTIAQCQMGFIGVIVKPLYSEWRKLLGDDMQPCMDALAQNLSAWETQGNTICEGWDV